MKKIGSFVVFLGIVVIGYTQTNPQELSIKALLEKESATWRAKDVAGHAACWQIRPYSRILVSTGNGVVIDVPPIVMIHPKPENMGDGGTSVNSNYTFSIQENSAWVSHEELSTSAAGKQTKTYEIRLLEKINGQWKLVGQSIMVQQPIVQ
jgi:hypothetical protein